MSGSTGVRRLADGSVQFYWLKRFSMVITGHSSGVPVVAPGEPLPYLANPPGWRYVSRAAFRLPAASRAVAVRPLADFSAGALPPAGVISGGGYEDRSRC
jgi:hypothetical protein